MRTAIGLGSNVGDRLGQLRSAVAAIGERLGPIIDVSSLYESAPVGGPAQESFLNAVVVVDTTLEPAGILSELYRIEREHQRTRDVHWGPRTLDLDIIAIASGSFSGADLLIPHVRAHQRRFVLDPLREVWPDVILADGRPAESSRELSPNQEITRRSGEWLTQEGW